MSTRQIDKTLLFPIILNLEFTETTYQNILAGLFFIIGHTIRMGFHDEGIVHITILSFNIDSFSDTVCTLKQNKACTGDMILLIFIRQGEGIEMSV